MLMLPKLKMKWNWIECTEKSVLLLTFRQCVSMCALEWIFTKWFVLFLSWLLEFSAWEDVWWCEHSARHCTSCRHDVMISIRCNCTGKQWLCIVFQFCFRNVVGRLFWKIGSGTKQKPLFKSSLLCYRILIAIKYWKYPGSQFFFSKIVDWTLWRGSNDDDWGYCTCSSNFDPFQGLTCGWCVQKSFSILQTLVMTSNITFL